MTEDPYSAVTYEGTGEHAVVGSGQDPTILMQKSREEAESLAAQLNLAYARGVTDACDRLTKLLKGSS